MPKKVTFDVTANTGGAKKGLTDVEQATNKLHGALDRFGPVGSGVANILGKMGFSSVGMAAGVTGAAVAVGAAVKIAEDAIQQYTTLGDAVRKYSEISGQSAEDSTRQVFALKELGIDSDTASAGMFKLSKAAGDAHEPLQKLGIEVVKTKDGSVDLNATLLNVISAWQGTTDAVKQTQIVFAAFGKSGTAMLPLLETNSAELKRLEAQVQLVFTQEDLDAIRKYKIAQQELKQSNDDLGLSIGRALLPVQTSFVEHMNESIYVTQHMDEELKKLGGGSYPNTRAAMKAADEELRANYRASLDARDAQTQLTASMQEQAAAAKAEADAENTLYNALQSAQDASFAYRQSYIDLAKARADARNAAKGDPEAELRLEQAYINVAQALVALKEKQAEEAGGSLTAAQSAQIQIDKLHELEKGLNKKSQLYKTIEGYIALLRQIPQAITTTAKFRGVGETGSGVHGNLSFAEGGTVPGPTGQAQLAIVHGGETVTPVGGSNSGGGGDVHYHIGNLIASPGSWDWLANQLLMHARRRPGT